MQKQFNKYKNDISKHYLSCHCHSRASDNILFTKTHNNFDVLCKLSRKYFKQNAHFMHTSQSGQHRYINT